jgi:hypothetical protein
LFTNSEALKQFDGIGINKVFGKSLNLLLSEIKSDIGVGFHPIGCDTLKSIFDHEAGHSLVKILKLSENKELNKLFTSQTKDAIIKELSGYASYGFDDFIAEGWAEYRNNPNSRPLAVKIGEIILERYARWKKQSL